jgi:hypothetical protein
MATLYALGNERDYEAELGQCVGVTGYHHWFFLSALAAGHDYEFQAFAVESAGERLGVLPLLFRRRGPVSTANFAPVGCIGPVLRGEALRAGRLGELLHGAEPVLRRHRTVAARWGFAPGLTVNVEELASGGLEVLPWDNYVIQGTKSVDDLLKSMSRSRRQSVNRHVRRGQERGVTVGEASAEEITRYLPQQVAAVYERQGRPPLYNLAEVRTLAGRLASHPRMLWRVAKGPEGEVAGLAGAVIGDGRLWGWLISGTPVHQVSVQLLCYWDLINWSLARGLTLDMGGAPSEGIHELRISLGAEVETAVRALRFRPRVAYQAAAALRNWGPVRANWARLRWMIGD